MAPGELIRLVKLDLLQPEEAARLVEKNVFSLSGSLPVNTTGGLAARGHPIGATGLAPIAELVWQLRGDAGQRQVREVDGSLPRYGLAQNSGGHIENSPAALSVTILKG